MIRTSPSAMTDFDTPAAPLLSDEPTVELVLKAREGNRHAVEALLERCLPRLRRWAHGKLPPAARGRLDTGDLVQETVLHVLQHLDRFVPRHVGAMQAYLRQAVINRICDEVRRVSRQGAPVELPEDLASDWTSPLEAAIAAESVRTLSKRARETGRQGSRPGLGSFRSAVDCGGDHAAVPLSDRRRGADGGHARR